MENNAEQQTPLYSILFVCLGNICRSPAAEGIMKHIAKEKGISDKLFIDSAGIGNWHEGELPDARMRVHGSKRGYDFNSRARQIKRTDLDRFDLILVMDEDNYEDVCSLTGNPEKQAKVRRMADYLNRFRGRKSVPDPYYGGEAGFELVLDLLEDGCTELADILKTAIEGHYKDIFRNRN